MVDPFDPGATLRYFSFGIIYHLTIRINTRMLPSIALNCASTRYENGSFIGFYFTVKLIVCVVCAMK